MPILRSISSAARGERLEAAKHRTAVLFLAVALSLALVVAFDIDPVDGTSRKACRVRNADSGLIHTRLQAAVRAAKRGDKLVVRGTCAGHTAIGKRLTIVGKRTKRKGGPQLTGYDKVRVLTIAKGAKVRLRDLVVTRGDSKWGGGIQNNGELVLTNVKVRGNRCHYAGVAFGKTGGIYNRGWLELRGRSRIQRNWCDSGSSAVWNVKRGTVVLDGVSTIAHNSGVYGTAVVNAGTWIMNGTSAIAHNVAGESTGGVWNSGRFIMRDRSTIKSNDCGDPDYCGVGGVSNGSTGTFLMMHQSSIRDNEPTGVATAGTFEMKGASAVTGNTGWWCDHGAGVLVTGGRFVMSGSSRITGNRHEPESWRCKSRGGGLYHVRGTIHGARCAPAADANVYGNEPDDCYFTH